MILQLQLEEKERVERRNQSGTKEAKRKVNDVNREKNRMRVGNDCKRERYRVRGFCSLNGARLMQTCN